VACAISGAKPFDDVQALDPALPAPLAGRFNSAHAGLVVEPTYARDGQALRGRMWTTVLAGCRLPELRRSATRSFEFDGQSVEGSGTAVVATRCRTSPHCCARPTDD